jgi:fluoride exporter
MLNRCLCVLVGGGCGSLTRYLLGRAITQRFPNANFAWGTFAINVSGSFLIGFLMGLLVERLRVSPYWHLILVVGFLGGYTTFSSFEYDGYLQARAGNPLGTLLYLVSSVLFGYAAVWCGALLAGKR